MNDPEIVELLQRISRQLSIVIFALGFVGGMLISLYRKQR